MRALLLVATAAVVGLAWSREESRVRGARAVAERPATPAVRAPPSAEPPEHEAAGTPAAQRPSGVEKGPCALHLRLLDDTTGEGLGSWVELWRLGIRETAEWTWGDQRQGRRWVGVDGHVFADLPPGRYRVLVYGQRSVVEDSPAFEVEGDTTERALFVTAPRRYRARLRVFTETGAMVTLARLTCGLENHGHSHRPPEWVLPRRLKTDGSRRGWGGVISVGCGSEPGSELKTCTERGFELCAFRENGRRTRWLRRVCVSPRERSSIVVHVTGDRAADRTYVGVAVPLDLLYGLVLVPDGGLARDAGASFRASSVAIPANAVELARNAGATFGAATIPANAAAPWQSIPVSVSVRLDGYENLHFKYRVDRPPAMQAMRPQPVSEPE